MNNFASKNLLYLLPIFLLIVTKLGIVIFVELLPIRFAWIPSFIWYWALLFFCYTWGRKKGLVVKISESLSFRPIPKIKWMLLGIVFPAALPLGVFILNLQNVPAVFIVYIILFAHINPWFEEIFWRYTLSFLPGDKWLVVLYSAGLFSFSHYVLWHHWFVTLEVLVPTLVSTLIMGILWMLFLQRERKYIYVVISHVMVDIFNLSVAVYYGLDIWNAAH